ncbi:MAG: rhodanese-like domain-containing protein [Halanaeroarchaeum sp.]
MVDEIDASDLARLREEGEVRIVDVRTGPAFERGHLPGSEHVPFHALTDRVSEFAGAERIVTVCEHGEASKQAASLIAAYEDVDDDALVASLEEGIDGWDGPLEADVTHEPSRKSE